MGQRVLVVDDDARNRELLVEFLGRDGYEVATASDGIAALYAFAEHRPDLVLLDIQMPLLDGFKVCRRLKADPDSRLVPIILVTALSALQDRVRGIDCGADDFLTKPVEYMELRARVRSLLNLKSFTDQLEQAQAVLFALAESIEAKDPYTKGHCERLAQYAAALGRRLGLSEEEITALQRAGIVHDIGKVAVPEAILLKPARLTPGEFEVLKQHPEVGEKICRPLRSFKLVNPIIRHHHEKLDGTGYPDGLRGAEIPATARVLQVVDVYDALRTARPYKPALTERDALATLASEVRKGWWDPDVFAEFSKFVTEGSGCEGLAASA